METTPCNCIETVEAKTLQFVKDKNKDAIDFEVLDSGFNHKSIHPKERLYAIFTTKSRRVNSQGQITRPKSQSINIFFNFCPFCGVELTTEKNSKES